MISTLALLKFALAGHKKDSNVSVMSKGQPTYTCPNGFELQGKKCVRFNEEALIPVCEEGLLRQDAKDPVCYLSQAPREVCPEGFVEDGMVCVHWDTIAPHTECPKGYGLVSDKKKDVYCEKTVKIDGPLVCPQGTVDDGKACVQYSYITPMWSCPAGTVQEGKFCASFEEYNCSEPTFPGGKKKHHLRMLKPKKDDVVIELGKGHVETIVEVQRTCRRTNYSPAVAECPPGTFSEGKQCKVVETFNRQPTNPILTYESADVITTCPAGFDWCPDSKKHGFGGKKGDMCCSVMEKKPFWECDSGYVLKGNRCVAYQQPVYVCKKSGYKKDHKKGNCSLQEYREPLVTYKVAYTCEGKDCGHGHKH